MDHTRRRICIALAIVLGVLLARQTWHSVAEILEVNDFEVFHHIGEVASGAQRDAIYQVVSPVKQRGPFLYPPSAAVLLIPLSWLPHDAAGVVFTIVKMACLVVLLWGAVRFAGVPQRDWLGVLIAATVTAAVVFRPIDSDIGNGQINFIIAAAGAGGVWLMMTGRRWWLGAVLLAGAVAVKLTPVLLIAVPLLHRRWNALRTCVAALVVLLVALPAAWFGWSSFAELVQEHREASTGFTLTWTATRGQTTPTELVQFVLAHRDHSPFVDASVDQPQADDAYESGWALRPLNARGVQVAQGFWLAFGLLGGAAFLAGRWAMFRGRRADWTWDLAILCGLIVVLSPRVQKAHLVILIVPMAWVICRVLYLFVSRGFINTVRSHWGVMAGLIAMGFLLLISDDLPVPTAGLTTEPARPAMLGGVLLLLGLIARLERPDLAPPWLAATGLRQSSEPLETKTVRADS